jgi:chromosomal replication initiator protein
MIFGVPLGRVGRSPAAKRMEAAASARIAVERHQAYERKARAVNAVVARIQAEDQKAVQAIEESIRAVKRIRVHDILEAVSEHFHVSYVDLISDRRTKKIVRPRQVAMYLARELTTRSLPEIGRSMGGKDHTTVIHGVRKIEQLIAEGHAISADVAALRERLTPVEATEMLSP